MKKKIFFTLILLVSIFFKIQISSAAIPKYDSSHFLTSDSKNDTTSDANNSTVHIVRKKTCKFKIPFSLRSEIDSTFAANTDSGNQYSIDAKSRNRYTNHLSSTFSLLLLLPIFLGYVVWKNR